MSTINLPKISIVTPSYNQGQYLEECIDSLLSQGYPNFEFIIMDGGSTDDSVSIIKKYEEHLTYWQSEKDGGQYAAINEGLKKTTGDIMGWLNSDDKHHPHSLYKIAYLFMANIHADWITGRHSFWNQDGSFQGTAVRMLTWNSYLLAQRFTQRTTCIQQESTFWRRKLWNQLDNGIDTTMNMAGDFKLWLEFSKHAQLFSTDSVIAGFRKQPEQKTAVDIDGYIREGLDAINELKDDLSNSPYFSMPPPRILRLHPKELAHFVRQVRPPELNDAGDDDLDKALSPLISEAVTIASQLKVANEAKISELYTNKLDRLKFQMRQFRGDEGATDDNGSGQMAASPDILPGDRPYAGITKFQKRYVKLLHEMQQNAELLDYHMLNYAYAFSGKDPRINSQTKFVFHHLPRCGGTSLRTAIAPWFDIVNDYRKGWTDEYESAQNLDENKPGVCICGHFESQGHFLHERYPGVFERDDYQVFSFIRNPYDTKLSNHSYYAQKTGENPDLEEYLLSNPNSFADLLNVNEDNYKDKLDQYFLIGILEEAQVSLDLMARLMGKRPVTLEKINKSNYENTQASNTLKREFEKANNLDMEIYQYCREKFSHRLSTLLRATA